MKGDIFIFRNTLAPVHGIRVDPHGIQADPHTRTSHVVARLDLSCLSSIFGGKNEKTGRGNNANEKMALAKLAYLSIPATFSRFVFSKSSLGSSKGFFRLVLA